MNLQEKKRLLLGKGMKTEDQSEFTYAAAEAALADKKTFKFQGKTYPVKMNKEQAKEIVNESIFEEYLNEDRSSELSRSIEDSEYFGTVFTGSEKKGYRLASGYSYVEGSGFYNSAMTIADVYQKASFRIPKGTPIVAKTNAVNALQKAASLESTSINWRIWIGAIPAGSSSRKINQDYDQLLREGLGFILEHKSNNTPDAWVKWTKALISAGFRYIAWDPNTGFMICAIPRNTHQQLYLSSTAVTGSDPYHPIYHLHKDFVPGYRQGNYLFMYRSLYGNLPRAPKLSGSGSRKEFTDIRVDAADFSASEASALASIKHSRDEMNRDVFGDKPHHTATSLSIPALNALVKNPKSAATDNARDFLQSYGVTKTTVRAPNVLGKPEDPQPEDSQQGISKSSDEVLTAGENIMRTINRYLNFGTSVQTLWATVSNAAIAAAGFTVRNRVPISISGLLALAIAGPFLFRLYLKNRRNIQNTRTNMNDPDNKRLIKELGFDVDQLKSNMTEKELKAVIQSIEKEEMRDPVTRRLYDL